MGETLFATYSRALRYNEMAGQKTPVDCRCALAHGGWGSDTPLLSPPGRERERERDREREREGLSLLSATSKQASKRGRRKKKHEIWGAKWPGGLTDPSCPGEEEERETTKGQNPPHKVNRFMCRVLVGLTVTLSLGV